MSDRMGGEPPRYTAEVLAALNEQTRAEEPQPSDPGAPDGMLRYTIAVEEIQQHGVGRPALVAAVLRAVADQIDPSKPLHRSVRLTNSGAAGGADSETRDLPPVAAAVRDSLR